MRILGQHLRTQLLVVALFEGIIFFIAPYIAASLRLQESIAEIESVHGPLWSRGAAFCVVMMLSLLSMGLYSSRQRAGLEGIAVRLAAGAVASFISLACIYYLIPEEMIGRGILAITVAIGFAGCVLTRSSMSKLVDENIFKRRIVVFGAGVRAFSISQLRRRTDQRGFYIVGFIASEGDVLAVPPERILTQSDSLLELCRRMDVDEIVVAMDDRRRAFPVEELLSCRFNNIDVVDLPSFLERETGKVRLDILNPSWMIFADGFSRSTLRQFSTRSFDIIASFALLIVAWPLMLFTALAIKLEDGIGAPVLYRQTRVGFEGRTFDVLKFRSMRVDAEKDGRAQWAKKEDRRVTRVGSISRSIRLDELPQIFNVLAGDMSFVGPRPERPEFVAQLSERIPYYRERHFVKPGITGWAQLCYPYGSSEQDAAEKLQYDLYYVKNHSLLFDLSILLQTAEVIFWRKGAR